MLRNACLLVIVPWRFERAHVFPQELKISPRIVIEKQSKEELVKDFELLGVEEIKFSPSSIPPIFVKRIPILFTVAICSTLRNETQLLYANYIE